MSNSVESKKDKSALVQADGTRWGTEIDTDDEESYGPYYYFRDQCEALGIDIPIVPGIMPISRFTQLARFSDACGAEIPRWIRRKLEGFGDDAASIRAFGLDVVTRLCDDLLRNGAPGLHFYTLNQAGAVTTIWQRLGL